MAGQAAGGRREETQGRFSPLTVVFALWLKALAEKLEELLDELAEEGGEGYGPLRSAYRKAMDLEARFFGAHPGVPKAPGEKSLENGLAWPFRLPPFWSCTNSLPCKRPLPMDLGILRPPPPTRTRRGGRRSLPPPCRNPSVAPAPRDRL